MFNQRFVSFDSFFSFLFLLIQYVVFAQKSYHRQHWLNRQRSVLSNNFALDVIPSVRRLDSIRSKFQCRNQSFVAEQNGMLTHSKWLDPAWPNAQEVPLLLPLKNDQHPTNSLFLDHSISSDLKTQTRQCDLSLIAFDRTISDEAATDESIVEVASNHLDPDYLEWDSYEEDTIAIHNETEQLILEIDEITKGRYTRSCAFD